MAKFPLPLVFALVGSGGFAAPFTNGSFELPSGLPTQMLEAGSTVLSGWIIGGTGGPLSWTSDPWGFPPSSGARALAFNVDFANVGGAGEPGRLIAQTFDTVIGKEYQVTFFAALGGFSGNANGGRFSLRASVKSAAGVELGQITAMPELGYSPNQFRFVATSSTTTLEFLDTSSVTSPFFDVLLDNIVVIPFSRDYGDGRHGSYELKENKTIEQLYQAVRLPTDPPQYDPTNNPDAVPNFQNLTIVNGATLTANPWNGTTGGRIVLKVQATLSVAAGAAISVNGLGYRGGIERQSGESYAGFQAGGTGGNSPANYGGGGAGYEPNFHYSYPGGGGGYGSRGGDGAHTSSLGFLAGGRGGETYGSAELDPIHPGSGGGGGVNAFFVFGANVNGGNGGGAIQLHAGNLQLLGRILANGGDGGTGGSGGGGGGSGGSILVRVASATLGTNQVIANGGSGGPSGLSGGGGNGGVGRIRVEYAQAQNFSGTTSPVASTVFDPTSDNITVITTQPVAQSPFLGGTATFSVVATGLPQLQYQWYFNAAPIAGATGQTLSLSNLALTQSGNYWVKITNAVMTVASSNALLTVLDTRDSDGDGIPNYWELRYGLNPNDPSDANNVPAGDRLTYRLKFQLGLDPIKTDADGDEVSDYDEMFEYGTDPLKTDTDGDGMPDNWELDNGLNPLVNDAGLDADGDGLTNLDEFDAGTDPRQRNSNPADGFSSDYEKVKGTKRTAHYYDRLDRLVATSYDNGAWEGWRYDGNGNIRVHFLKTASDADGDGLPDVWEFAHGLAFDAVSGAVDANGFSGDADGDGWTNYQEFLAGTSPTKASEQPPSGGVTGATWFNPPRARVIFPPLGGGGLAQVDVRVWDAEANPALIFLQWFDPIARLWNPATVLRVDDLPVTGAPLASAPGGITHSLSWNAQGVLPAGFSGQVLLRVTAQDAAGITVSEAVPYSVTIPGTGAPIITGQPLGRIVPAGQAHTFSVTVAGTSPFSYQWSKDGVPLSGATTSSYALADVQVTNAGSYAVTVTNSVSSVTSQAALLIVGQVGHEVAGNVYAAGGLVTVSNTLTYSGVLSALGWHVLLPTGQGWTYAGGGGSEGDVKPVVGTTELLEWAWTTIPASPVEFTYLLRVPPGQSGEKALQAHADMRQSSLFLQALVTPDPLVLANVARHSADTDGDSKISLTELLRVIELYNTRYGTVRTGAYVVDAGNLEDGFGTDPARSNTAVVTLTRYHSGDSNHDGKLSLTELLRVIELYNTRSGTVRTGEYHVQAGTEDGFAPGP